MQSHYFFFNHYSWSFLCSHKFSKEMEKYRLNGPTHILFMSIYLLQWFLNTCGTRVRLFLSPCTALMEGKLPAVRAVYKMVSGLSKMVGIPTGHMNLKCLAVYPESTSVEASPVYIKTNILITQALIPGNPGCHVSYPSGSHICHHTRTVFGLFIETYN